MLRLIVIVVLLAALTPSKAEDPFNRLQTQIRASPTLTVTAPTAPTAPTSTDDNNGEQSDAAEDSSNNKMGIQAVPAGGGCGQGCTALPGPRGRTGPPGPGAVIPFSAPNVVLPTFDQGVIGDVFFDVAFGNSGPVIISPTVLTTFQNVGFSFAAPRSGFLYNLTICVAGFLNTTLLPSGANVTVTATILQETPPGPFVQTALHVTLTIPGNIVTSSSSVVTCGQDTTDIIPAIQGDLYALQFNATTTSALTLPAFATLAVSGGLVFA